MTAAVYGRHSLDELQQLVVDAFSPVVDQQLPVPDFSPDVFTDQVTMGTLRPTHSSTTSTYWLCSMPSNVALNKHHPVSLILATSECFFVSAKAWHHAFCSAALPELAAAVNADSPSPPLP
jgi:hypothetical protein